MIKHERIWTRHFGEGIREYQDFSGKTMLKKSFKTKDDPHAWDYIKIGRQILILHVETINKIPFKKTQPFKVGSKVYQFQKNPVNSWEAIDVTSLYEQGLIKILSFRKSKKDEHEINIDLQTMTIIPSDNVNASENIAIMSSEEIENLDEKEINAKTMTIQAPFSTIRKIKKESKRKRRKDGNQNLKNSEDFIVEVRNLSKNYISGGKKITRVLSGLNLNIKRGEFVVLFGKSGSGKSTLLNIISGLDRPTKGNVIVANENLPYLSNGELTKFRRKNLSFIFQQYHLLNNITGYENVETGQYLQKDKSKRLDLDEYFRKFDLQEVMHKYPSQMSGGQQQRISILRALSKNSDIIFADEPTGALDKKTGIAVLEILKHINKTQGKTIIMVSHDPEVVKYTSRVIVLDKGKILTDKQVEQEE